MIFQDVHTKQKIHIVTAGQIITSKFVKRLAVRAPKVRRILVDASALRLKKTISDSSSNPFQANRVKTSIESVESGQRSNTVVRMQPTC